MNKKLRYFSVNVERFSTGTGYTFEPFEEYLRKYRTLVVVDEATVIKNPEAKRTIKINKIVKNAAYRLALTGTPVTNSPMDIYSIFEYLKPGFWGRTYYSFRNKYCIMIKDTNQYTGRDFNRPISEKDFAIVRSYLKKNLPIEEIAAKVGMTETNIKFIAENPSHNVPYKNLKEIKDLIAPHCFTITKEECLDLPDKIYEEVTIDMSKDQEKIYKDLRSKYLATYAGQALAIQHKMTLFLRLQQVAGGFFPYDCDMNGTPIEGKTTPIPIGNKIPKIERLKIDIEEAGDKRIIVWSRFVAEIELIIKQLRKAYPDKRIEGYYGGVHESVRTDIKKDFQEGLIDVIVINPQTGSMGLNFQIATLQIFYSNHFSLSFRLQAEDRSHRIGQTEHVVYKDYIAMDTVDEKILNSLKTNKKILDFFRSKDLTEVLF